MYLYGPSNNKTYCDSIILLLIITKYFQFDENITDNPCVLLNSTDPPFTSNTAHGQATLAYGRTHPHGEFQDGGDPLNTGELFLPYFL